MMCMWAQLLSVMSDTCDHMDHQAPLSVGFPARILLSTGGTSEPGIKPVPPRSLALAGGFFITVPPGKSMKY